MPTYSVNIINSETSDDVVVALPGDGGTVDVALPTPQIARKRIFMGSNPGDGITVKGRLDGIHPRRYNVEQLMLDFTFPTDYYKEKIDVYFNSFGDRDWLNLPDLRVELCMVKKFGPKRTKSGGLSKTTTLDLSGKGIGDNGSYKVVHPPNINEANQTAYNTIYSGGNGGYADIDYNPDALPKYIFPTEWKFSDGLQLNRNNNPNIEVEIDIRNFFYDRNTNEPITYPFGLMGIGSNSSLWVKNLGKIDYTAINQVYDPVTDSRSEGEYWFHKRNPVIFFRLSAGDPKTAKVGSNAYYKLDCSEAIGSDGDEIFVDLGYGNTFTFILDLTTYTLQEQLYNELLANMGTLYYVKIAYSYIKIEKKTYESVDFTPYIQNTINSLELTVIKGRDSDPSTFYQKRLFSDLSQPIKLKLKIGRFIENINYPPPKDGLNPATEGIFVYGHKISIG
jgi:hypothetical protein